MPNQVQVFDLTCPESTPTTAPVVVETFTGGLLTAVRVTIVIPDGHSGLTGITLGYGNAPAIPLNEGAWISGNDESMSFDLHGYPDGVPWQAFLCNNDLQPHGWQVRWEANLIPESVSTTPPQPIPAAAIYVAGNAV